MVKGAVDDLGINEGLSGTYGFDPACIFMPLRVSYLACRREGGEGGGGEKASEMPTICLNFMFCFQFMRGRGRGEQVGEAPLPAPGRESPQRRRRHRTVRASKVREIVPPVGVRKPGVHAAHGGVGDAHVAHVAVAAEEPRGTLRLVPAEGHYRCRGAVGQLRGHRHLAVWEGRPRGCLHHSANGLLRWAGLSVGGVLA